MIRVLIADSQILTREGIKSMLSDILDIKVVGCARSSVELEQVITQLAPQVIIIDHDYDTKFTAEDIKNVYLKHANIRMLVLSNRTPRNKITDTISLGIKNYVFKECSREEREDSVNTLSSRETEIIQLIAAGMTNKEIAEKLFLSIHTVKTHRKNIIKKIGFTFKNASDLMSYTNINLI